MKLQTSLTASHDVVDATDDNLIHDAMAAHALMQAMDDWTYAPAIKQRADELMRHWGFGEAKG